MARNRGMPYRPTNPRSITGAKKYGWHVVKPGSNYVGKVSWMGLNIWCEHMSGYWVSSFRLGEFPS